MDGTRHHPLLAMAGDCGEDFADAAPLVLLPPTGVPDALRPVVADRFGSAVAIGGTAALPNAAVVDLVGAMPPLFGPIPPPQ